MSPTGSVTTSCGNNLVWTNWNYAYTTGSSNSISYIITWRAARIEQQQKQRVCAEVRARSLLVDHLDSEQRESLAKRKCFELVTRDAKRRYRVYDHGPVKLLDGDGAEVESFCIHEPGLYLPKSDSVLAKALLLEANEERFLKIANRTVLRRAG